MGELARRTALVQLLDGELVGERRAAPVKRRRCGVSGGELVVALAESQLVGGECFDDLEELRADAAGAPFSGGRGRAGGGDGAAAGQALPALSVPGRRARPGARRRGWTRALDRDPGEPVTIDVDATVIEVYGRGKRGASSNRTGQLSFAPHLAFWAQRGRALCGELASGKREKLPAIEAARICRRALRMLPAGHGPVCFQVDSAYYALELLTMLRAKQARFTVSVPRTSAMWKALGRIAQDAWRPATDIDGAEVAETPTPPRAGSTGRCG